MSDPNFNFTRCFDLETRIGEGPVWDERTGLLWFVDILAPAVFSYAPGEASPRRFDMPDLVTSIGLADDGRLVLSLRRTVRMFEPRSGAFEPLATPELGEEVNRLNDGKVGPDGCFWVGSMHDRRPALPTGKLFRITPDGNCDTILNGVRISNGLAWSPDGRTMYHADSRAPSIVAYDFDAASGAMSNARLIALPDEAAGLPDGAAIDAAGNYWSAGVTAGCINVYSPIGDLTRRITVPMAAPTMPCFGGDDLRMLFLTGLTRETGGAVVSRGGLFACRSPVKGTLVGRFGLGADRSRVGTSGCRRSR